MAVAKGHQISDHGQNGSLCVTGQLVDDVHVKDVVKEPSGSDKLHSMVSGPTLTQQMSQGDMDRIKDIPFEQLCTTGAQITRKNWLSKIW